MKTITLSQRQRNMLNVSSIEISESNLSKPFVSLNRQDGFSDTVLMDDEIAGLIDGDIFLLVAAINDKISRVRDEMEEHAKRPQYYPGI